MASLNSKVQVSFADRMGIIMKMQLGQTTRVMACELSSSSKEAILGVDSHLEPAAVQARAKSFENAAFQESSSKVTTWQPSLLLACGTLMQS